MHRYLFTRHCAERVSTPTNKQINKSIFRHVTAYDRCVSAISETRDEQQTVDNAGQAVIACNKASTVILER